MDEMRKIVTPKPAYSDAEREIIYRSLVFLAKKMTELGHHVIIDATGNLRRWRNLAREIIPKYTEVYLRCPLKLCMERETKRSKRFMAPKDIYKKGAEGSPVPGMVAPYEEPLNPEVIVDTDKLSLEGSIEKIELQIAKFIS
jgi:adenylylsulfate kinase